MEVATSHTGWTEEQPLLSGRATSTETGFIMGISLTSTSGKVLASVAVLGVAASVAGMGTYGAFTASTSASESVSAGTVNIALGAAGADNRLAVAATGVVPGDTIQRAVKLSNTGSQALSAVTLTTSTAASTLLTSDATNGLQVAIDACSLPWIETGTAPAYTYTCAGTTTSVLASRAILGTDLALNGLASVATGASDNLRVTTTLPASADNTFQGLSSTVDFAFVGTQRTATNK